VEYLHDRNGLINPTQATLMLLGIYEDTGSLTYASTTSRDIRGAAYLVDHGASLKIAADYLNPPLSPDQRMLYDRLLDSAQSHHIHGNSVIVATSRAEDMNEEISTIAHKLRDLLDPDALVILVTTKDGVRLIARSTSDRIDVARLAMEFGGGGHERASAALLHPTEDTSNQSLQSLLDVTHTQLIKILPDIVQPSIRVRKVMSRRPLLISPTTSTAEAQTLMQKYGYEGYPVVDNGKVVGLLTRRAVDRAISHRLNLPTSSLMEAGDYSVSPDDPIEKLQEVMTSTGWGQIPVVDPVKKHVIGIATRTDLLKTLRLGEVSLPRQINLAEKLLTALPPARYALLRAIQQKAEDRHAPIYIVGGFVRDLLLDHPGEDFDIVVEGDAISLAKLMSNTYGGRVVSHSRFGTAKWQIGEVTKDLASRLTSSKEIDPDELPVTLDFISARREFYEYPTALPVVERSNIKLDLHRRDFTINTMALRLDGRHHGELYDFWGGLTDLKQKQVRVLHSLSFVDDPTRMLRAVRFEQRFQFRIESRTLQLISEAKELLRQVSGDRIRHEFNLVFQEENPPGVFRRMEILGLLNVISPELSWGNNQDDDWKNLFPSKGGKSKSSIDPSLIPEIERNWLSLLARLQPDELETVMKRLKLPTEVSKALAGNAKLQDRINQLPELSIPAAVKFLDGLPDSAVYAGSILYSKESGVNIIKQYIHTWKNIHPTINGKHLEKMGIPRGPRYRQILDGLRAAWLNGDIHSKEEENVVLGNLIAKYSR
jgi:tRNA nucleotidyltransferase (CCA-adding enzyme)